MSDDILLTIEPPPVISVTVEPAEIDVSVVTSEPPVGSEIVAVINAELGGSTWQLGGGGGEFTVTAGEILSAFRVVTLDSSGQAVLYDPAVVADASRILGVTKNAVATLSPVVVVSDGVLEIGSAGFTPQARYYAGAAGQPTTTRAVSGIDQAIGYAADADTFVVHIEIPIQVA